MDIGILFGVQTMFWLIFFINLIASLAPPCQDFLQFLFHVIPPFGSDLIVLSWWPTPLLLHVALLCPTVTLNPCVQQYMFAYQLCVEGVLPGRAVTFSAGVSVSLAMVADSSTTVWTSLALAYVSNVIVLLSKFSAISRCYKASSMWLPLYVTVLAVW